eukprot:CAMPEP_0117862218 /NCGR_PEP_ID=MMETSP0950-20121206/4833_1 /TAXON_ID=44440 /ORGANISM="Chattonella subsalsa, Strain CCMP2191" /LENGTH=346 /DNA_ID=CAMNT_0005712711 /DNA_START=291 /DNA_END=1331 /DNA_ORIENTATION=-
MLLQYGSDQGYESFRKDLGHFLSKRYEFPISFEALMVSNGNSHGISLCCSTLCSQHNQKKVVFVEDPSYFLAFNIFKEQHIDIVAVGMDAEGMQVSEVEALIQQGKIPSMVYTIPAFHNPTGTCMSEQRMDRLVQLAIEHNFVIVADEPYPLLNYGGKTIPLIARYVSSGHVVSLGSFSKILAPGLRLGWIHASPILIKKLAQSAVIQSGGCVNPVMAGIVHSAINLGYLEAHIDNLNQVYCKRKKLLSQALKDHLPEISFLEPQGGYFIWCKLPAGIDSASFLEVAKLDFGVGFTPGKRCSSREAFSDHIRLSFAFYSEEEIIEGVKRLRLALDQHINMGIPSDQ